MINKILYTIYFFILINNLYAQKEFTQFSFNNEILSNILDITFFEGKLYILRSDTDKKEIIVYENKSNITVMPYMHDFRRFFTTTQNIYLNTFQGGLFDINSNTISIFCVKDLKMNNVNYEIKKVNSIYSNNIDDSLHITVGNDMYYACKEANKNSIECRECKLERDSVYSIYKESTDNMYISSNKNLFSIKKNETFFYKDMYYDSINKKYNDNFGNISFFIKDSSSNILIFSNNLGWRINNNKLEKRFDWKSIDTLGVNQILDVKIDKNDNIWILTSNSLVLYSDKKRIKKVYGISDGFITNFANKMAISDDNIYISTGGSGVYKFNIPNYKYNVYKGDTIRAGSDIYISVNFISDKYFIDKLGLNNIKDFYENVIVNNKKIKIEITGYTVNNSIDLAKKRYEQVSNYLFKLGLDRERIKEGNHIINSTEGYKVKITIIAI